MDIRHLVLVTLLPFPCRGNVSVFALVVVYEEEFAQLRLAG
jgi:hypothetical protein